MVTNDLMETSREAMNYNSFGQQPYRSTELPSTSSSSSENTFSFSQVMEGYDYEFVPPVEQRYECPICLLILREPRQTKCGHRFCRDCIIKWLRCSSTRCPVDNEPLLENDVFPDNFAKREILNFNIKCPNKKDGCEQVVTLGKLQPHCAPLHKPVGWHTVWLKFHLEICPHSLVPCPYRCASILHRRDLEEHKNYQCDMRLIQCERCSESIQANTSESHIAVCPNVLLVCVYCGQSIPRAEINTHIQTDCQQVQIGCMFAPLGCNNEMIRSMQDEHLKLQQIEHMKILCQAVKNLMYQFEHLTMDKGNQAEVEHVQDGFNSTMSSFHRLFSSSSGHNTSSLTGRLNMSFSDTVLNPITEQYLTASEEEATPREQSYLPYEVPRQVSPHSFNSAINSLSFLPADLTGKSTANGQSPLASSNPLSKVSHNSHPMANEITLHEDSVGSQNSSLVRLVNELKSSFEEKLFAQQQKIDELSHKLVNVEKDNMDLTLKVKQLEAEQDGRFCVGDFYWRIPEFSQYQLRATSGEHSMLHSPPFYTSTWGYKMCIRANIASNVSEHFLSLFIHLMQGQNDNFIPWPFSGKIILSIIDQNPDLASQAHITETLVAKPSLAAFQKPTSFRNHKGFGYIEFTSLQTLKTQSYLKDDAIIIRAQVCPENK